MDAYRLEQEKLVRSQMDRRRELAEKKLDEEMAAKRAQMEAELHEERAAVREAEKIEKKKGVHGAAFPAAPLTVCWLQPKTSSAPMSMSHGKGAPRSPQRHPRPRSPSPTWSSNPKWIRSKTPGSANLPLVAINLMGWTNGSKH